MNFIYRMNLKNRAIRLIERLRFLPGEYHIDLLIQKRFIGDRRIKSVNEEAGVQRWQSTTYDTINNIFFLHKHIIIKDDDIFVDVGCGDGKVFNLLLYRGRRNKMIGYELNKANGRVTKKALSKYKNVEIILEDIFDNFPVQATIFYLFNPFGESMMLKFIDNFMKMKDKKPKIVYYNPLLTHLFDPRFFDVSFFDLPQYKYPEGKYAIICFKD